MSFEHPASKASHLAIRVKVDHFTDTIPARAFVTGDGNASAVFGNNPGLISASDLRQAAPWTAIIVPSDDTAGPPVTVIGNGNAPDDITVIVPADGGPAKFARVAIEIP